MPESYLAKRFGGLIVLTAAETAALARIEERTLRLRRGTTLLRENDRTSELYVLRRGMMMSYVLLGDGSRQIIRFVFPGDLVGTAALAYRTSPETVVALGDCEVSPFERSLVADTIRAHPRIGALVLALTQVGRVASTDRLAAVGRTSARARVGALLLDIRERQRQLDPAMGATFAPGVTQEEIGDATGLTAVHVNRMLRQLEEIGLIAREGGRITLLDEAKLARVSGYANRLSNFDLDWLPPAAA